MMHQNIGKTNRRSIRLADYNYQQPGIYFVTLVIKDREQLFGEIVQGKMLLSQFGMIANQTWIALPKKFPHLTMDDFIFMPDHMHGIVIFNDVVAAGLPEVIRYFKSFSARWINHERKCSGTAVWQRNYYDHVVRTDDELEIIRQYIDNNPMRWEINRNHRHNP